MKILKSNILIDGHLGRIRRFIAKARPAVLDIGIDWSVALLRSRNSIRTTCERCTAGVWRCFDRANLFAFCGLLLLQAVGLSACGGDRLPARAPQGEAQAGVEADTASLISRLRAQGAGVERTGTAEQPFLSVTGTMIKLEGGDIQLFEFPSAADMEANAAMISRDGSAVGTSRIRWIGSPHFFKQGKVLVLYVGNDAKVLKALETVLGRQFAGR